MESIRIIHRTEHSGQVREEEICIERQRLYPTGVAAPIPLAPQPASAAEEYNTMVPGDADDMNRTLVEIAQTLGVSANAEDILHAVDALRIRRAGGYSKIFDDGSRTPSNNPRTDHVAVIDHATGLMWAVESLGNPAETGKGQPHEKCVQRCAELRLLGHDDWRLPTHSELSALVDVTRREPAIDTNLFPRVLPRWHWTSTPLVDSDGTASASDAWGVDFGDGDVNGYRRGSNGFALAVRRSGQ